MDQTTPMSSTVPPSGGGAAGRRMETSSYRIITPEGEFTGGEYAILLRLDRIIALLEKSTTKPEQRPGHYPQWVGTAAEVHPHPIGTADIPTTGE